LNKGGKTFSARNCFLKEKDKNIKWLHQLNFKLFFSNHEILSDNSKTEQNRFIFLFCFVTIRRCKQNIIIPDIQYDTLLWSSPFLIIKVLVS